MDPRIADQRRRAAAARKATAGRARRRSRRRRRTRCARKGRSVERGIGTCRTAKIESASRSGRRRTVSGLATALAKADAAPSEARPRIAARRPPRPPTSAKPAAGRTTACCGRRRRERCRIAASRRRGLGLRDRRVDGERRCASPRRASPASGRSYEPPPGGDRRDPRRGDGAADSCLAFVAELPARARRPGLRLRRPRRRLARPAAARRLGACRARRWRRCCSAWRSAC